MIATLLAPRRVGAATAATAVTAVSLAVAMALPRAVARAQSPESHSSDSVGSHSPAITLRAQALGLVTRVDPALGGRAYTEGYLLQPMIMAHGRALRGHLGAVLTLDFEGLTLERGQLTPGAYGEGYVDRRHPHTYLHEALGVAEGAFRGTGVSLAGGKGFVPFGTDDPMMRPFAAYPVNHHLAQILERYALIGAVRRGPFSVEAALFNGDEPRSPGAPPDVERFGDSWAVRVTATVPRSLELVGSYAFVTSPELVTGGGLDQRKWSAAARFDHPTGLVRYALVEWAHTDAFFGDVRTNRFTSFLAEGSAVARPVTLSARFEDTTRPEEERLLDPFRTSRSPTDLGIIGITRWRTGTVAASIERSLGSIDVAPFVEATYARPTDELRPSAFVPREFYGASSVWALSAGVRLGAGRMPHRMGRYGAALPNVAPTMTGGPHVGH